MIDTLKNKVWRILKDYPKARDDDSWLFLKFWEIHYPTRVYKDQEKGPFVYFRDILLFQGPDSIGRVRQIIQNQDNEFLPNSEEVRKLRRINEQVWHDYCIKNKK